MNKFKNLSDDTILRIKVPAHLYESVKKELSKKIRIAENVKEVSAPTPKEESGKMEEWVGLDPHLYTAATLAGLGLPAVVALIAAGPKTVGQAVYDLAVKAKEKLAGKKDSGDQSPVAEKYSEE